MRKLYMKQVVVQTSTYSSDEFGVCSALYELGGMVVMHDASGCNSTYTTHDEPRWYDLDSMIYISAISEMEAIMGDDGKLIDDLTETAKELKPEFIALVGAPIPYMTGTDFPAIARIAEQNTGIPCFGFPTNGMEFYTKGISLALETIVRHYCTDVFDKPEDTLRVNILGATPLDFSVNQTVEKMAGWLEENGFEPGAVFAMGCSLEELKKASAAHVNLVVSYGGLAAARLLEKRFGTPFVVGVPYGKKFSGHLALLLHAAADYGDDHISYADGLSVNPRNFKVSFAEEEAVFPEEKETVCIIGESVLSASLAKAIEAERPEYSCRVICPVDTEPALLDHRGRAEESEERIKEEMQKADLILADPLYRTLCPEKRFIPLPHTAFSGRIFEKEMPVLIGRLPEGL